MADEILFDSDEAAEFDQIERQEMDGDESPRLRRGLDWQIQAMPVWPKIIYPSFEGGFSISIDSASKAIKDFAEAFAGVTTPKATPEQSTDEPYRKCARCGEPPAIGKYCKSHARRVKCRRCKRRFADDGRFCRGCI